MAGAGPPASQQQQPEGWCWRLAVAVHIIPSPRRPCRAPTINRGQLRLCTFVLATATTNKPSNKLIPLELASYSYLQ